MTLLNFDGFDLGDVFERYSAEGNTYTSGTRFSYGRAWGASGGGACGVNITPSAEVIQGSAHFLSGFNNIIFFMGDAGSVRHLAVFLHASGSISAVRGMGSTGSGGTTLNTTVAGTIPPGTWCYVEVRCIVHDTLGEVEVRLNGNPSPVMLLTGVDTRNGGVSTDIDRVEIRSGASSNLIDDWYTLNTAGAVNNDFLGDVRVFSLAPNGNGNSSGMTGSDGNSVDNYQLVDEVPFSTADYVESNVANTKDTYAMEDLPAGVSTIFGTVESVVTRKSDAGTGSVKTVLRAGGTDYASAEKILSPSWVTHATLRETNPSTSAAWTASGVNGVEVGLQVG